MLKQAPSTDFKSTSKEKLRSKSKTDKQNQKTVTYQLDNDKEVDSNLNPYESDFNSGDESELVKKFSKVRESHLNPGILRNAERSEWNKSIEKIRAESIEKTRSESQEKISDPFFEQKNMTLNRDSESEFERVRDFLNVLFLR